MAAESEPETSATAPPLPPSMAPPPPPPESTTLEASRSILHTKLRAYELKRRTAYTSKLSSSSLYWRAFRSLLHDSLVETSKADILLKGWCHLTEQYASGMVSLSEFCVERNGTVVTDEKRKKKMLEEIEAEKGDRWGDEKCASMVCVYSICYNVQYLYYEVFTFYGKSN